MIAKIGEPREIEQRSGTYDSITLFAFMKHTTANTAFAIADFKPQNVAVKVILTRKNRDYTIFNDNFQVLGTYFTMDKGYHEFLNGRDLVSPASGIKAQKLRTAKLNFTIPVRIDAGDTLYIEVSPTDSTFSANVDITASYLSFDLNPCIGYQVGIPSTRSKVIETNTNNQEVNPGDYVTRIALLNFDQDDCSNPVITTLNLASDKLNANWTFNQLQAMMATMYGIKGRERYGTALPVSAASPTVYRGSDAIPQSYLIFEGLRAATELHECNLTIGFNSAAVNASQNYLVYSSYVTDLGMLKTVDARVQKHRMQNTNKVKSESSQKSK